jgi:uncharacterized protein YdeI (YjbR/CyaY-like superfamily)
MDSDSKNKADGIQELEDGSHLTIRSGEELRQWLQENGSRTSSIWLVTYKKSQPQWHVSYKEVVDILICFGWIDSLPRKVDAERSKLRISPRNPKSVWSAINKRNVERLTQAGLMQEAGQKMVALAKANGTWDFLNDVDQLIVPDDLLSAFTPEAKKYFDRFPPSSKRAILEWIKSAKTSETRNKRLIETASKAALNLKANFPEGKNKGPAAERL